MIDSDTESHWSRDVFRDEFMVSHSWLSGTKITKLTLALLADTNYYDNVDLTVADTVHWGYQKGCSFAQG